MLADSLGLAANGCSADQALLQFEQALKPALTCFNICIIIEN
jgi:thiamine pyrophosphokinase